MESKKKLEITEKFIITGFDVGHSIPGAMCCLFEVDDIQLLYTGDLRFHGNYQPDLDSLNGLKPDIMITEGTRIDEETPDDEKKVKGEIGDLVEHTKGLVMVGFAWKDLERYDTIKKAAIDSGRTPIFDSRVAYLLARLGRDIYSEGANVFVERTDSMLYSPSDYTRGKHNAGSMDEDEWSCKEPKKVDTVHLTKGIKANEIHENPEKYVLHLDYFRFKNLLDIDPPEDSVYVRAQCEPFDPRMEISETRMVNWLRHFRINQQNGFQPFQIHASGHASGKELQDFVAAVKPKKLIPIHTIRPELFYNKSGDVVCPKLNSPMTV